MALFKISKGDSKKLLPGNNQNPNVKYAKEGFAYFTTDDGKFYVDIAGDGLTTPAIIRNKESDGNRVPLNAYQADFAGEAEFANLSKISSRIAFGTCTTDGNVINKIISIDLDELQTLTSGSMIAIYFLNGNTVANPKLEIDSIQYPIYYNFTTPIGDSVYSSWESGSIKIFTFMKGTDSSPEDRFIITNPNFGSNPITDKTTVLASNMKIYQTHNIEESNLQESGWIRFASLDTNASNEIGQKIFDFNIFRTYSTGTPETYNIRVIAGWSDCTILQLGGSVGTQRITQFRVCKDSTERKIYFELYLSIDTPTDNNIYIRTINYTNNTQLTFLNEAEIKSDSELTTWTLPLKQASLISNASIILSSTSRGLFLTDSTEKLYGAIYNNASNLWVGATATNENIHTGSLCFHAGKDENGIINRSVFLAVGNNDTATTATNYVIAYGSDGGPSQPVYVDTYGIVKAVSLKPTLNNLLNSLTEGTADALVDAGYFISTNNNGATDDWYLRSNIAIWNYIKGKYSSTDTTLNTGPIHIRSTAGNNNALIFDRTTSGGYQYIQSKNPDNNISIVFAESNSDANTTYRFTKDEFYPKTNNSKNLGLSENKWANVYATNFNGALKGNADTATAANITSTDNAIVRFDGTAGKFQNSNALVNDNGGIISASDITIGAGYLIIKPYSATYDTTGTHSGIKFYFNHNRSGYNADTLITSYSLQATNFYGALKGNADTATAFSSNATVTLTGDTTGTSAGSTKSWSVPTVTSALTVKDGRVASADSAHATADHSKMYLRIATNSMKTNKPKFSIEGETAAVHDGHILEFHWDNSGAYNEQLALSNSKPAISVRANPNGTWSAWTPVLTSINTKWVAWGAGTTAGPTAKLNIGGTTITSAAIPLASTTASGIVTTGEQSFTGKKTFDWLRVVNNSSANADDALFYIENKNSGDWAQKIFLDTFNYGLYIQGTGTSLLKVGTNNNFTVNSTTAAFGQQANPITTTTHGLLVIDRTDVTYTADQAGQGIPLLQIRYNNTGGQASGNQYQKNILKAVKTVEASTNRDASSIMLQSGGGNLFISAGEHNLYEGNNSLAYFLIKTRTDQDPPLSAWPLGQSESLFLTSDEAINLFTGVGNSDGSYVKLSQFTNSGLYVGEETSSTSTYLSAITKPTLWSVLRLNNGSNLWDIATKSNDLTGALQFRPAGAATYATTMSTSGNWTFKGSLNPATNNVYDLGSETLRWQQIHGNLNGARAYSNGTKQNWEKVATWSGSCKDVNDDTSLTLSISDGYPNPSNTPHHNGLLYINFRGSSNSTTAGRAHCKWIVGNSITPADWVLTYKITSAYAITVNLYVNCTSSWQSWNIVKINEHTWGTTINEWQLLNASSGIASLPTDETQIVSTLSDISNTVPNVRIANGNGTVKYFVGVNSTGSQQLYYNSSIHTTTSNVLMGAAWNDYAEFRQLKENKMYATTVEPGRVVYENGDDTLSISSDRLIRGCSIVSDTYGFGIGESEKAQLPVAVSGRVLAYPYEDREKFRNHIGWPVCSGPNGTVSIMTEEEEMKYPSRIIGTISTVPDYEIWHGGANVIVNGRVWIKVR